ncbi:helix-turn-helix transcriptional regulator [Acetivibrio cellulolyticus]|uniref:helix-turn-helix transcriptional regulator n=1 Tax=Acetivibrio cellulolyticus TaxID=35830 RepID=UPI0001E2BD99|nr:helix-turn-helix transcriptional regulator [Acetivibrio cellulolyticus]
MGNELFKNNLRVYRAKMNWTQEDLAKSVGVTRKTINTIENGVFIPSAFLALKIAKVFHETVENIFFIAEENEKE